MAAILDFFQRVCMDIFVQIFKLKKNFTSFIANKALLAINEVNESLLDTNFHKRLMQEFQKPLTHHFGRDISTSQS